MHLPELSRLAAIEQMLESCHSRPKPDRVTYRVGEFQFYRTHRFFVQKGLLVLYSFFLLIRILNSRTCIETGTVLDRGGNPESAALVKEDLRGVVKKAVMLTVK